MKVANTAPSIRPGAKSQPKKAPRGCGIKPQTWRAAYCRNGHYLGMVPVKLPNGRLALGRG
jgi:hypothetical protein